MARTRAGDGFTPADAPDDPWNTASPAAPGNGPATGSAADAAARPAA